MLLSQEKSKWAEGELEFADNIYLLGRSRGQKIRGIKYRQYRPQVIIADDLEDLDWVRKKENRDKTERWFNSEVVPAQDELKCKMILIGNFLHNDALMARIKKRNLYRVMEFPLITDDGVITWKGKYPNQEAIEKKKKNVRFCFSLVKRISLKKLFQKKTKLLRIAIFINIQLAY